MVGVVAHAVAELHRQDDLVGPTPDRLTDDHLGLAAAVHVSGVDHVDAGVERSMDDVCAVLMARLPHAPNIVAPRAYVLTDTPVPPRPNAPSPNLLVETIAPPLNWSSAGRPGAPRTVSSPTGLRSRRAPHAATARFEPFESGRDDDAGRRRSCSRQRRFILVGVEKLSHRLRDLLGMREHEEVSAALDDLEPAVRDALGQQLGVETRHDGIAVAGEHERRLRQVMEPWKARPPAQCCKVAVRSQPRTEGARCVPSRVRGGDPHARGCFRRTTSGRRARGSRLSSTAWAT